MVATLELDGTMGFMEERGLCPNGESRESRDSNPCTTQQSHLLGTASRSVIRGELTAKCLLRALVLCTPSTVCAL